MFVRSFWECYPRWFFTSSPLRMFGLNIKVIGGQLGFKTCCWHRQKMNLSWDWLIPNGIKTVRLCSFYEQRTFTNFFVTTLSQGILKGEVSLYCWPPVWLVWNQMYDNLQFLFLFAKQTNSNRSNRRSMVQRYFPL